MTEINKMITLSTGHLSQHTRSLMSGSSAENAKNTTPEQKELLDNIPVYPKLINQNCIGWFVYIPKEYDTKEIPSDLLSCIKYAEDNGINIICFDNDGPICSDIKYMQ